jgi:large subunit ribosomal protein L3
MSLGLVGRKIGMTRIFTDDGHSQPVTVLDVSNNRVTQIKTPGTDGYSAVQVTFGKRRASRVTKPLAGHFAKAAVEAGHIIKEFRVTDEQLETLKPGASHGNSKAHNKPGSIGMCQDPGRVFPGKRMAGHLGNVRKTTQNLEVLRIDTERGLLLIKGAIPGSRGGDVLVHPSFKITSIKQPASKLADVGKKDKKAGS